MAAVTTVANGTVRSHLSRQWLSLRGDNATKTPKPTINMNMAFRESLRKTNTAPAPQKMARFHPNLIKPNVNIEAPIGPA